MTDLLRINTDLTHARASSVEALEEMIVRAKTEGLDWVVIVAGKGPDYLFKNSFVPDYLIVLGSLERASHLLQRKIDEGI